jgi:hypothetical protein
MTDNETYRVNEHNIPAEENIRGQCRSQYARILPVRYAVVSVHVLSFKGVVGLT